MSDAIIALALDERGGESRLYVARESGLYRFTDGGQSGSFLYDSLNLDSPLPTTAVAVHQDHLFAGVQGGILKSSNDGATWHFTRLATPPPIISALATTGDGGVLAGTLEDGVFHSPDWGQTWNAQNYGLLDSSVLAFAAADSVVYAGTGSRLFSSRNGGHSWNLVVDFPPLSPILSLAVASDGSLLIGTEARGLWHYSGSNARQVFPPDGEASEAINHLYAAPDSQFAFAACDSLLLMSDDEGRSWRQEREFSAAISAFAVPRRFQIGSPLWLAIEAEVLAHTPL